MSVATPDDDDVVAAAMAALRQHERIKSVLDAALVNATSSMLAELMGEGDDSETIFIHAMWAGLDSLDDEERVAAIVMLLEPVAEKQARSLLAEMHRRMSLMPEAPGG